MGIYQFRLGGTPQACHEIPNSPNIDSYPAGSNVGRSQDFLLPFMVIKCCFPHDITAKQSNRFDQWVPDWIGTPRTKNVPGQIRQYIFIWAKCVWGLESVPTEQFFAKLALTKFSFVKSFVSSPVTVSKSEKWFFRPSGKLTCPVRYFSSCRLWPPPCFTIVLYEFMVIDIGCLCDYFILWLLLRAVFYDTSIVAGFFTAEGVQIRGHSYM